MESRLQKKCVEHNETLKNTITQFLSTCDVVNSKGQSIKTEFLHQISSLEPIHITASDFTKRKRINNILIPSERCKGMVANNKQCSRRHKSGTCYCGIHMKNLPFGQIEHDPNEEVNDSKPKKTEIWLQNIKGINQYVDSHGNIYKMEDILNKLPQPAIIGNVKDLNM